MELSENAAKSTNHEIGLYIHWPFCVKKCHYCDLNSHVRTEAEHEQYVDALCAELDYWRKQHKFVVKTIFFGGGTPSLMRPEWVARILTKIYAGFDCHADEITMEMNPSVSQEYLHGFRDAGINRVSFGVQSFDDEILRFLGRDHTAAQAHDIIKYATNIYNNISLDLMYYLPNQTLQHLSESIERFLDLNIKHVSCYSLTIEENTVFGNMHKSGTLTLPSDDAFCEQYEFIVNTLADSGFAQYELGNFAISGYESQHNLIYWRYRPFLGIGPGAHSRIFGLDQDTVHAIANHKIPEAWLRQVLVCGHGVHENECLAHDLVRQEELMMKLRLNEGMSISRAKELFPEKFDRKINNLVSIGDVVVRENRIALTSTGFMRYNSIINYITTKV